MSDSIRLKALFKFVIDCLAQANKRQLSERDVGLLLGASNREEGRRLFRAFRDGKKKSIADIVSILAGLRRSTYKEYISATQKDQNPTRLISAEHIHVALQKLIQLTPEEKEELQLPSNGYEILLQQAFLNMLLYQRPWDEADVLAIYRTSTSLPPNLKYQDTEAVNKEAISEWVRQITEDYQRDQLAYNLDIEDISPQQKNRTLEKSPATRLEIFRKVQREINRILLKTGTSQLKIEGIDSEADYIKRYLPYGFIKRLTQTVLENELLTEELGIFIQNVSVEQCGPSPLKIATDVSSQGILSQRLINFGHPQDNELGPAEIASHTVNKVTVKMYMRLSEAMQDQLSRWVAAELISQGTRGSQLSFEITSAGIGGTFSHVVKLLNYSLFYDIACLQDYFPIAHEVIMDQDIIRSGAPSPVVAHSLVKLCKVETLSKAMHESQKTGKLQPYERFSFDDPIGRGDFCDFDTLTAVSHAALQARLRAIKFTGVAPEQYLGDLQSTIDKSFLLRKARAYRTNYPFSSLAQQSFLYAALGKDWDCALNANASRVYFKVQMELVESFLIEDLHARAKPYLDNLAAVLESISDQGATWFEHFGVNTDLGKNFRIFPGTLLVRYELCQATYHYLTNQPDEAWKRLKRAENHVNVRLAKYSLVDEVSQATFHPHYALLAQIYFLQARLLLFFPFSPKTARINRRFDLITDVMRQQNGLRTEPAVHVGRLHLFEKARLYAACNGDSELYACLTAYQCCSYLIIADPSTVSIENFGSQRFSLTATQAEDWARRMRDQALLSYAEVGRRYYYQIKEKSGISDERHPFFGDFTIDAIPAIRELRRIDDKLGIRELQKTDETLKEEILYLDMSILGLDKRSILGVNDRERGETVYLFGTNACHLFFARGMYHLCSNDMKEFEPCKEVSSLEDWNAKMAHAHRLFSYAWAIADDGGSVEVGGDGDESIQVKRSFTVPDDLQHLEKDAASVRGLYPHRITEIASLGRLYSAACILLRGYTFRTKAQINESKKHTQWLLNDLHSEDLCQQPGVKVIINGQQKHNKHMENYLRRCRRVLEKEWEQVESCSRASSKLISQRRAYILKCLFAVQP